MARVGLEERSLLISGVPFEGTSAEYASVVELYERWQVDSIDETPQQRIEASIVRIGAVVDSADVSDEVALHTLCELKRLIPYWKQAGSGALFSYESSLARRIDELRRRTNSPAVAEAAVSVLCSVDLMMPSVFDPQRFTDHLHWEVPQFICGR